MITFYNRPSTEEFGTFDDSGITAGWEYLDAIWAQAQLVIATGVPVQRARCSSSIACIILGRPTGTTMYPGDSPMCHLWCGQDRGSLQIWEDVALASGAVVLE
jgi:hypothetical protein